MPTTTRTNRYAGTCARCSGHVPAETGALIRTATGWGVEHDGPCPDKPIAVAQPTAHVNRDGMYRTPAGTIYKVQIAKQGSRRLYAKRLVITQLDDGTTTGTFEYAPGEIHKLTDDMRMSAEQAATFGQLYGICCVCAADLTDETSIARGIGPICAKRF